MKKIICVAMAAMLLFSLAACGTTGGANNSAMKDVNSLTVLETVWGSYKEDEKFAVTGGIYSVENAPGSFDVSDKESLDYMLGVPSNIAEDIDNAASMIHMMNANTFTCGSYQLKEGTDMETFAAALKDNIMNRQWMCGFPDTLIVVTLSDTHVVAAFGKTDPIETFKTNLAASYDTAEVIFEESLV